MCVCVYDMLVSTIALQALAGFVFPALKLQVLAWNWQEYAHSVHGHFRWSYVAAAFACVLLYVIDGP